MSRGLASTTSRRQALKLLGGGLAGGLAATAGLNRVTAQTDGIQLPTVQLPDGQGGTFNGTLVPTEFFIDRGQLAVSGNVLNTAGKIVDNFTAAVEPQQAKCEILRLELGPLFLNVLGLEIEIARAVVIVITADPQGGVLGELLCSIANLLSGNGRALGRLRNLLNDTLGALGGLGLLQ